MIEQLLDYINSLGWLQTSTICQLHNPCKANISCSHRSQTVIIDFDHIKDLHCKGQEPLASVDAIYKNEELLFIEIKGWKKYLEYHLHDISQKDIKEQITKYKLEKKLQDSLSILDILVSKANISDPHLFKSLPKQYIIVTDISTENDPLEKFAENLTFLATFSSGLNLWDATKEQIERFPSSRFSEYNISGPFLIYCKDFDRFIL